MAVHITVLTALLWLTGVCYASAASPSCLGCHPSHYADQSTCTGCHSGDDRTLRKNIAHQKIIPGYLLRYRMPGDTSVSEGEQWLQRSACRRCHVIKGQGNRLAANLDRLSGRHPSSILVSIMKPVAFMPDFQFDGATASLLVNALFAHAEYDKEYSVSAPVTVRFNRTDKPMDNIFEKQCGGCHRILAERSGGLGKGDAGPNLSGLLSVFYPKTYGNDQRWTAQRLELWLNNPRKSRPLARMQPVSLVKNEFSRLSALVNVSSTCIISHQIADSSTDGGQHSTESRYAAEGDHRSQGAGEEER